MFNPAQIDYLKSLDVVLSTTQQAQFQQYMTMLQTWGQAFNLTAITGANRMITHHFLDSLSVLPHLHGDNIVDVGTGAGLPGIPLAICQPQRRFCLIDSNRKKTQFLQQVIYELKLANVTTIHTRVENLKSQTFSCVMSRAFAELATMLELTGHLGEPGSHFLAMKGQYPQGELEKIPADFTLQEVVELAIPGLDAKRHVVVLEKTPRIEVQSSEESTTEGKS